MKATGNLILDKSLQFSLDVLEFTAQLEMLRKFPIANQLTKSGTSIGANIFEAQSPESKKDFVHKMKIAAKEASETEYWLTLCNLSSTLPDSGKLLDEVKSIQRILSAIIAKCKIN